MASQFQPLSVRITSGKCCLASWWTVAPTRSVINYMTILALDLVLRSMEYERRQFLTGGSDSRWLGEMPQFESPSLSVWSVLCVSSVTIDMISLSNVNFFGDLTILIPQLPCLLSMAKAVSSTFELVDSVTSNSVKSFNIAMCTFANRCFPIKLVPCSDGWWRTWWQSIHMWPEQQVSSIPHCNFNYHEGASLETLLAIFRFKPTLFEAPQTVRARTPAFGLIGIRMVIMVYGCKRGLE